MTDLQADILTNANSAFVAFDKINAKMIQLEQNTRKANRALRDQSKEIETAGRKAGMTFGQGVARGGKILTSAGGGVIGRVFGGAGMEGAFGRVAVGLGAVSLAFHALNRVLATSADRAQKAEESLQRYNKAVEAGQQGVDQQTQAGMGRTASRIQLLRAGGQAALDASEKLEVNGVLSTDEARSATAQVFNKFGNSKRAQTALKGLERLKGVGVDPSKALELILNSGAQLDNDPESVFQRAFQMDMGNRNVDLRKTERLIGGDAQVKATRTATGILARRGKFEDAAVVNNGEAMARKELGRAANPLLTAIGDANREMANLMAALARMAKSQGKLGEVLADFTQTEGSATTQGNRILNNLAPGFKFQGGG